MDASQFELAESQADRYRIFTSPKRILILWALAAREKSVSEIADMIDATLQNTSQHLRQMKESGLVEARREGQTVYYRLAREGLCEEHRLLLKACFAAQAAGKPPEPSA